jgi:ABC exporter DevB family membrane fusion protein
MTITRRSILYVVAAAAAILSVNVATFTERDRARGGSPASSAGLGSAETGDIAGPGRIESASEEVQVSTQLGGKLRRVFVDEGDHVLAGGVLAVLENDDYRARVASAEAELQAREADARRVATGARPEERREAAASSREAQAAFDSVKADYDRRAPLFDDRVISREEMDHTAQQLQAARARLDALSEHEQLVEASARQEDTARAAADVALANARLDDARATYEKTFIRAPISGVVLRRHRKAGEAVSTQFDSPIVTLADRSRIRARVDVDETDVGRLKVGHAAYVTADAFGARRFAGHVIRVGELLGKKNVRTDEPTERVDQKVLETLVELDDGHELPLGLRVQAFIAP